MPSKDPSDPLSYTCTCPARTSLSGGLILLFYRYFANTPTLTPLAHQTPSAQSEFHTALLARLSLAGKLRLSTEGFNITLGGTRAAIDAYIAACKSHWSFAGLDLSTEAKVSGFFKPTAGCACAFPRPSVRVTGEITPLGITAYSPASWSCVTPLPPADFHALCLAGGTPLVDVRNHYESRIGYFVTGAGDAAVRPAVRRFSQFPGYVARHVLGAQAFEGPQGVATYCTGGVRCEKGARWMAENLGEGPVYTLDGGIVAYQAWVRGEVEEGRMRWGESLFKGRNYVFDGRGAIGGKDEGEGEMVATCHKCGEKEDRLGKCVGVSCHLVLVVCEPCEENGGVFCCENCKSIDGEPSIEGAKGRRMCECETEREKSLWGDGGAGLGALHRRRKTKAATTR